MPQTSRSTPPDPHGALQRRALRPTVRRLRERAERSKEEIRPLLAKIAECFFVPGYFMFQIRREAGSTDWHVTLFAKELGMRPWRLVLLCRLEVAFWLLRETSLSVAAIAPLVGYADENGLRKLFRRLCGLTPAQARRYLRRVDRQHRIVGDEFLSWSLRVRFHRGEVESAELATALAYLEGRFGPA